ncbi:hypothetical protein [Paenibacillus antibioticophila]|uniref:hypothetical protein n=1 Tax=Paenibacillus antibioticophila TaxID=1274374 RepID=UPI0005CAD435|nr:hypothetical protein [Paenibacillus antibioticophila]
MTHYFKYKREKTGTCNICLAQSKLTWDHIPPKGGIKLSEVEQKNILQHLTDSKNNNYVLSQNGVKYRTICSTCNNGLLGAKYDVVLNAFANELSLFLKTSLQIPQVVKFKTQPAMIIKCIIGHLLAAKGDLENNLIDHHFRDYFLDDSKVVPAYYKVFYWVYPYNSIKIIRDIGMPSIRGDFKSKFSMFSTLRYFPIAFLITDAEEYSGLNEMSKYCSRSIEDFVEIPIDFTKIFDENWPEYGENNFIMGGESLQSGVSAVPRVKHNRIK